MHLKQQGQQLSDIPVVILSGGYGTRLKPLTLRTPKPMLPFANRPLLEHLLLRLSGLGFQTCHFLLLYRPEMVKSYFKEGKQYGLHLEYVVGEQDFGTAGAVRMLSQELGGTFLVVSGDLVTDVDFGEVVRYHREKGGIATLVLSKVKNPMPFGITLLDDTSRVRQFMEKPSASQLFSDTVNAGIYVLEPEIFHYIPANQPFFFAQDLFPLLLEEGLPVYGYVHSGYWQDIGDLRQYLLTHRDVLDGRVILPDVFVQPGKSMAGEGTKIARGVRLEGTNLLGARCRIGEGARIVNSVLGDDVEIGPGAEIQDCVIWSKVRIGAGARLISDVVATGTEIGARVSIDDNVFIAEGVIIEDLAVVKSNVKIWPERRVGRGATVTTSLIVGERWLRELFAGNRITGKANEEITPEFAARLGTAIGSYLGRGGEVLVSRDASPGARMVHRAIICGLMSAGVNIGDLRVAPLPILRFSLKSGADKGGIHVRQAPGGSEDLEIILLEQNGDDLPLSKARTVERFFMQEDFERAPFEEIGQLDFPVRTLESYQEEFLAHLDRKAIENARFKIVVDYSFGPAGLILPSILGALDCDFVALNAYIDPKRAIRQWIDFRYALLQLSNIVVSLRADAGFLIDATTERVYVVDEEGHWIPNEELLLDVLHLVLSTGEHRAVGVPVSAPDYAKELASRSDVQLVEIRQDVSFMVHAIRQRGVSFIADGDGGFVFPEFQSAPDGMFAMAKILELLAKNGVRFGALRRTIPRPVREKKEIACDLERVPLLMRRLIEENREQIESTLDGLKCRFTDGWILIRPSADQKGLTLLAEANHRNAAVQMIRTYQQRIENMIQEAPRS
jgi:mannose-1-phosphate guanylyltransferase/phosphomannomutase